MSAVPTEDLLAGGLLARQLEADSIAKTMLRRAVRADGAPYAARAALADVSAKDPDWADHEKALLEILKENKTDDNTIIAIANFYMGRYDWEGLGCVRKG